MPDDYDDQENEDLVPRAHIRTLEQKARQVDELAAQLEAVQRESAFAKALGTADHPGLNYFQKGYDGPLEVDAIREAAREAGFLSVQQAPTQAPLTGPTQQELAAHARMAASADGAGGGDSRISWQEALAQADRVEGSEEREAAILDVVERFGGVTSRTAQ